MKLEATVMSCHCNHEWQDKRYGNKQRVFNVAKDKQGGLYGRCTVCNATKPVKGG